jgi:hypothetical protein
MKKVSVLCYVLLVSACVESSLEYPPANTTAPQFDVVVEESYSERYYKLSISNRSNFSICTSSDNLPTEAGWVHMAADIMFVESNGLRFHPLDRNTGYCVGKCTVKIDPGAEYNGIILFKNFTNSEMIGSGSSLVFDVHFRNC